GIDLVGKARGVPGHAVPQRQTDHALVLQIAQQDVLGRALEEDRAYFAEGLLAAAVGRGRVDEKLAQGHPGVLIDELRSVFPRFNFGVEPLCVARGKLRVKLLQFIIEVFVVTLGNASERGLDGYRAGNPEHAIYTHDEGWHNIQRKGPVPRGMSTGLLRPRRPKQEVVMPPIPKLESALLTPSDL